ncbi:MAG: hypothetical protein U0163_12050 [Gemmatimonadaceae bacterium]
MQELASVPVNGPELDAAVLQAAVALGLSAYARFLFRRYQKAYFSGLPSAGSCTRCGSA